MKPALSIAVIGCVFILGSCALTPYTPTTDRPMEPIIEFTTTNSLSLINGQDPKAEIDLISRRVVANLRAWTDTAIKITARELKKRRARVAPGEKRSLRLIVTHARDADGFLTKGFEIDMLVQTGDGYVRTYTGRNSSALVAVIKRQIDGAMMRVVAEMLKDPKIISYLTK
jgi:hypothetical protein